MIYVIFTSNRARENTLRLFSGIRPTAYYSWERKTGKGVYALTEEQYKLLKEQTRLKGWRKFKYGNDLLECWNQ